MIYPKIKPVSKHDLEAFRKNPKYFIEGKLELLRTSHPLVDAIHRSIIQNNLSDSDFYLFLAYYAMAELIEIEELLITNAKVSSAPPPIVYETQFL